MKNIKKNVFLTLLTLLSLTYYAQSQVVDWLAETSIPAGTTFTDGQIISNIAGTGLNARINVNLAGGSPRTATTGTIVAIGPSTGNAAGASFSLTFLNGTADIQLNNMQNMRADEDIIVSNPDGIPILVTQTSAHSGRLSVDGTAISSNPLPQTIIGDSNIEITAPSGGSGNVYRAAMAGISGFTWLYETNGHFEGFTLTISNPVLLVVPVELTSFEVSEINNNQASISWETASEINNDFFTIERSKDSKEWESVSIVEGGGSTNELKIYNYIDRNPYSDLSYYRLKQTDFDGQFSYSDIRSINIRDLGQEDIVVYPNPTADRVTINYFDVNRNNISIMDSDMKNVTHLVSIDNCTESICHLDFHNVPKGIYFIQIADKVVKLLKN